jgi:hypothetical protein
MRTHCLIFPLIGNLVSLSNSLFDGQVGGGRPGPSERKIYPFSAAGGSRAVEPRVCCVAQATRDRGCLLVRSASIHYVRAVGLPSFRWSRDRFVAQLLFGSYPVLDIFSVFAAALKIQIMS